MLSVWECRGQTATETASIHNLLAHTVRGPYSVRMGPAGAILQARNTHHRGFAVQSKLPDVGTTIFTVMSKMAQSTVPSIFT